LGWISGRILLSIQQDASMEQALFQQSGANFEMNPRFWGIFKVTPPAYNSNKKGGLFSRLLIAGEGFEPPTFGL
jgi:hypothetical protein